MIIIRSIFISIIINYYHYYCELWIVLNIHYIFIIIITYYYYHYYVYVYIYKYVWLYMLDFFWSSQISSNQTGLIPTTKQPPLFSHQVIQEEKPSPRKSWTPNNNHVPRCRCLIGGIGDPQKGGIFQTFDAGCSGMIGLQSLWWCLRKGRVNMDPRLV